MSQSTTIQMYSWTYCRRRVVTFLIIAPYKYPYLLTWCLYFCRAVRIELFTARVLYRISYPVLDGSSTRVLDGYRK